MNENILNNFVEMERYKINPFGCFGNMNKAIGKEKKVVQYLVDTLKPEDEIYFMLHRFKQMLKCQRGIILDRNEEINTNIYTGESENPGTLDSHFAKEDCGYDIDIHCSTKKRGKKVDEMNMILEECKKKGMPSIMVTIVPPIYLDTPYSDKEMITIFHRAIQAIFRSNQKHFKKKFYVHAKSKFYEIPVKAIDFRTYLHTHFVMTFLDKGSKKKFLKKFDQFKKKVYEIMAKHFNIKDKEYYKENCAYIRIISDSKTEEKDILELENAEYLRKSYGGKKGKSKKKFKDWDEKRRKYYLDNLKNPNHFDRNKGIFINFSEDEEKVVKDFYSKVFVKTEKDDKFFCLNFDEILWIGGDITRKDLALRKKDYNLYCKIMHLKTWALKRYLRQLSYLYDPDRATIAIRPYRIGNEHYSMIGGSDKVKEELKKIREEKREKREMKVREEYRNNRREETIESIKDEKVKREIKEISEDNNSRYEEVKKQKTKLAKFAGFTFNKIDSEIFYRWYRVFRTGTKLYNYLWENNELDILPEDLTECLRDEKDEKGGLDWKDGLKRLYELTEENNLDRSQIFLSEYLFKGNEYEKYFPVKITSDKSIDSALELKLGITLKEFNSIWYYYRIEELKSIVAQLIKNAKTREELSREEFENNVNKILHKMRSIKFDNNQQLRYIIIFE